MPRPSISKKIIVSLAFLVLYLLPVFLKPFTGHARYAPLDMARAVREQYGPAAVLVETGNHLYAWKAKVQGRLLPLDLRGAVMRQYGRGWIVGAVGVHKYDWRAIPWSSLGRAVLPVMLVSSDHFGQIQGVRRGARRFSSVLKRVHTWYGRRAGKNFRLLEPLVLPVKGNAAYWKGLCRASLDNARRFDFIYKAIAEYRANLPLPQGRIKVVITLFTGNSPEIWMGAASQGDFAVIPPYAASLAVPASGRLTKDQKGVCYAVGHELGHTFGLGHSCSAPTPNPNCQKSIMENTQPPEAILTPHEVDFLTKSVFFK